MKTRFTMSRTGQTVCYGSVFEVKKEIPVLMADPSPIPARRNMDKLPRTIAAIVLLFVTSAIITYLFAVVTGHVHKENRLGLPEVGLGLVACLFLILVIYPAAFDRLSLLKLPGGIEVTLEKIQRQQVEQRRELDAFFSILANLLSPPEKYHLRLLGRPESDET